MNKLTVKIYGIKFGQIFGYLYIPESKLKAGLIMLGGAPSMGDDGRSAAAKLAADNGICVIKPDYIGVGRSDGKFTFRSTVDTIYKCLDLLKGRVQAINAAENKPLPKISLTNIVLSGGSFGGAITPFVELYQKTSIQDILLVMPLTNWVTQNAPYYKGDESIAEFENVMKIALKNIWRGYHSTEWPQIVRGKLKKYNPIDNTRLLKGKRVYIYHGTKDKSVSWHDSYNYYLKLKSEKLVKSVIFEKLVNHRHTSSTATEAMRRFINVYKRTNGLVS